jgi:arylsulfatase A-like enzyme
MRPDIVFVVIDTLRADRLAIHGGKRSPLPTVDKIAQEGAWFSRAFAQSGWTLPSFVSMFTGLYPHQHRVGRNPNNEDQFGALPDSATTLAESLKKQGYATGAVINNTFLAPAFGLSQGFDDYDYKGADNSQFRSAQETTQRALSWLEKQQGSSFLVVHYMEAHMNLMPQKEHRGRFTEDGIAPVPIPFGGKDAFDMTQRQRKKEEIDYVLGLYDEELWSVELALHSLVEGIKKQERWENTVFVITSDHGEEFWDYGSFEHGHSLMGVLTHIPLVVHGPNLKGLGKISTLVEHVDLYQGLMGIAGAEQVEEVGGTDIFSLMDEQHFGAERWSISENTLYGGPKLSILSPTHRLHFDQKTNVATVWNVNKEGWETGVVPEEDQYTYALPMINVLKAVRGHIGPIDPVAGPDIPDQQVFQQLKSLGYLDKRE